MPSHTWLNFHASEWENMLSWGWPAWTGIGTVSLVSHWFMHMLQCKLMLKCRQLYVYIYAPPDTIADTAQP